MHIYTGICKLEGQPEAFQVEVYTQQAKKAKSIKYRARGRGRHLHSVSVNQSQQDHQGIHDPLAWSSNNHTTSPRYY